MAERTGIQANQQGFTVYFRSPEPKEVQRINTYSIWLRYQDDGRMVEHAQRVEPSDVEGYLCAKWVARPDRLLALGVRKEHADPRITDSGERMYLPGMCEGEAYTIGPDGVICGKPQPIGAGEVVLYYRGNQPIYFHYCTNFRPWTVLPGERFEPDGDSGFIPVRIVLKMDEWISGAAVTDGAGWWDNNGGKDYSFYPGTYTIEHGIVKAGPPFSQAKTGV